MGEDRDDKRICCDCVGEAYLTQQVKDDGQAGTCSYCGQMQASISIEELADHIAAAFGDHYLRTATYPESWQERLMRDPESTYHWTRQGLPVVEAIEDAASIPSDAAIDVQEYLDYHHGDLEIANMGEETEFSPDSYYARKSVSTQGWHEEWSGFERSLKTEARFFSRSASELLARVFGGIDTLKTQPRRPLVVDAGPSRKLPQLYRARVFQSEDSLLEALCRPDLHLGSPSARLASAGRMNARGISVFYGATNAAVALAEVRPPVGSKVAIAKFEIIRPLRLLDLTALDGVQDEGSIFDPSFLGRLGRAAFLQTLGQRMTSPVMPDDEAFDYLATQAVADFLATENEPQLDGIIFTSAQAKTGRNVVLFHKVARVEDMQFEKDSVITASAGYYTEDGWETDYKVSVFLPQPENPAPPEVNGGPFGFMNIHYEDFKPDGDFRQAALRVDAASVEVHQVKWVKVSSTRFSIRRSQAEGK